MSDEKRQKWNVTYVYDAKLAKYTHKIPNILNRAELTHGLIQAYRLTEHMNCIPSSTATFDDLKLFHSSAYVDFLAACDENEISVPKTTTNRRSFEDNSEEDDFDEDCLSYENEHKLTHVDFGFGYDCPLFKDMGKFSCHLAGASLTATKALLNGCLRAINWLGGWHHGRSDEARGFCIINDIVLSILTLRKKFPKILYIDLDAHHGDGVEDAFSATKNVMTMSMHLHEPGFYPGSGFVNEVGIGAGKFYSVNVPLKSGVRDEEFCYAFNEVFQSITSVFHADAIVVQCGTDCLAGDQLGTGNLTEKGLGDCISKILQLQLPILFLGGGGYNVPNAAKCWAYLTSLITEFPISSEIPDHDNFLSFGPDYELHITPTLRKSQNCKRDLDCTLAQIKENLGRIAATGPKLF